jgi:glutamate-1-semialdehyde 2,1-aminomutase
MERQSQPSRSYARSSSLFDRACEVIPGGIYGHVAPALTVPQGSPYYASRAEGSRYWDVDGNEFIDFLCGYGPVVLGYRHPEVEEAAERQRRDGDCFNHPGPVMVELAEKLVDLVDFADWAVFAKNGSDMTTWAMQVSREHTRRKKILMVEGAYHGVAPWCTPGTGGLIDEDREHVHTFRWNDLESFDALLHRFASETAGVIVTPFHHPLFRDSELPQEGFLQSIQARCREHGIVLILDDVRGGFRLHLGGSHRYFGFEPDLSCFSKAMGNGYGISATVGRDELRKAAGRVFLTGGFWNGAVAMAAALATIRILERDDVPRRLHEVGESLCKGLGDRAAGHGLQLRVSGPPALPFMTFANESNLHRSQHFALEAMNRGVFFHPHHNWFLCAEHGPAEIDEALDVADAAFAAIKERFGD